MKLSDLKLFFAGLLIAILASAPLYSQCSESCSGCPSSAKSENAAQSSEEEEFQELSDDEFLPLEEADKAGVESDDDEFQELSDDEFLPLEEADKTGAESDDDEFQELSDDEFGSLDEESSKEAEDEKSGFAAFYKENRGLTWALGALLATLIAGLMVRRRVSRYFRYVFLAGSLIFLGFYNGGCPCPISSVQDVYLGVLGVKVDWRHLIWFLGLIPLTYIFGQTWCGWICHLGAFQDFLGKTTKVKFLRGEKAQKTMRIMRWVLVATLLIQLTITKTNLFCKIDPFKAAFNLYSYYTVAWVLLGLVVVSSIFIHRPFCKAACPIGFFLGFVKLIPGAAIIGSKKGECAGCKSCAGACEMDAIVRKGKESYIDNKDCILCGECLDSCGTGGLKIYRKGSNHNAKTVCKRDINLRVDNTDSGRDCGE